MRGYDSLVLHDESTSNLLDFVERSLVDVAELKRLSLDDLRALPALPGAEMASLFVLISDRTDIAAILAELSRIRSAGAFIAVLGVVTESSLAAKLELGAVFDAFVSFDWASSGEMIRRFVNIQRMIVQNRAFRAFLDHSIDGYWILNLSRDHLEWSHRTLEITGTRYEKRPRNYAGFAELLHPQDLDRVLQAVTNHLKYRTPFKNIEMRLRAENGTYGSFLANGQALRDETGHAIILVGSLTDRTLEQEVQQRLADTQKRFTVLFHQMNDAAVLADVETGLVMEANQPAELLWGKPVSELVGKHQSLLHPPDLSDEAHHAFKTHIDALFSNNRASLSVPILRADGTLVPTEISSSLIEIDGRTCILGVFRDIRDRIKAEQDLRERDAQIQLSSHLASMGTLAAGVAHEINNPLTYVIGNLDLMKTLLDERGIDDPELNEALKAAATGGRYVREIVLDLKAISRMDPGDNSCDAAEVLRIASRIAMSDLRHSARLEMDLPELPSVPMSSARLTQVVLNILSNATRAFPDTDQNKNRISIRAGHSGGQVTIEIEDNGVGIKPDDLKKVWEPFFTRSSRTGGTGLGLSICRRILQEAGGSIDIRSELGVGTTVIIALPVAEPDKATPRKPAPDLQPKSSNRRRLLVVDDDILVSNVVERMLRKDFDITVHNSAPAALKEIEGGKRFDVVLCDIMMPELDGPAFYKAVGDKVPFLFLTGGAVATKGIEFESRMAAEGRILFKPFETAELRNRLNALASGEEAPRTVPPTPLASAMDFNAAQLSDLVEALGRDLVDRQLRELLEQVETLRASATGLSRQELGDRAHQIAGAASVMAMEGLGRTLYACEAALADDNLPEAEGNIAQLGGYCDGIRRLLLRPA
jgi:PAS domain S-box-containing protein